MFPESAFVCNESCIKPIIFDRLDGIEPERLLLLRTTVVRPVKVPNVDGMLPFRVFELN